MSESARSLAVPEPFWTKAFSVATCVGHKMMPLIHIYHIFRMKHSSATDVLLFSNQFKSNVPVQVQFSSTYGSLSVCQKIYGRQDILAVMVVSLFVSVSGFWPTPIFNLRAFMSYTITCILFFFFFLQLYTNIAFLNQKH